MIQLIMRIARLFQDDDDHLQPFTGKRRIDYDVESHSLYVEEVEDE